MYLCGGFGMAILRVTKEHNSLIRELFEKTNSSIKIVSPFITRYMGDILVDCKEQSPELDAKIITRFYREDFIQGVSEIGTLKKLHNCGVKIYALLDLHAKLYLFDDDSALIGSANFTSGGFKSNHELSLCITDEPDANDSLVDYFDELLEAILAQSDEFLLTAEKIAEEQEAVELDIKKRRASKGIKHTSTKRFGAKLPTFDKLKDTDSDLETNDSIQTILSTAIDSDSSVAWLKFVGVSKSAPSINEHFPQSIPTKEYPAGIVGFPQNRGKPNIAYGDYLYIATVCKDEKGYTHTPCIVGRGRSAGYSDSNITTPELIARNMWLNDYPIFVPFTEVEYINTTISECIHLDDMLEELLTNTYIATMGKSRSITDLKNTHRQQSHLRLTIMAKEYLDDRFNGLVKKYGVHKLSTPTSKLEVKYEQEQFSNGKITPEMIMTAYEVAKMVYAGEVSGVEGKGIISEQTGMNINSAGDCINTYRKMREGERYTRLMNPWGTRIYFEGIHRENGDKALESALNAARIHVDYYEGLTGYRQRKIVKLIDEFALKIRNKI